MYKFNLTIFYFQKLNVCQWLRNDRQISKCVILNIFFNVTIKFLCNFLCIIYGKIKHLIAFLKVVLKKYNLDSSFSDSINKNVIAIVRN